MGWILPPLLLLLGVPLACSDGLPRQKFQYASRRIQDPTFLESAALEDKGGRSNYSFVSSSSICWCTNAMTDCGLQIFNSILRDRPVQFTGFDDRKIGQCSVWTKEKGFNFRAPKEANQRPFLTDRIKSILLGLVSLHHYHYTGGHLLS